MIQFNTKIFPQTKGSYIIGGSIRDMLLGRIPTDYDIAVTENPEKYAKKIAANTTGHLVEMGKPGQTIIRVVSGDNIFDITSLNGKSIEDDLKKRDFTINAMAYELSSGEIIDCLGGLQDLDDKKIRMVSKNIFRKDPIRLIRAYRIGACLDFEIESQTVSLIRENADLIQNSAGERIRVELFKMLGISKSYYYLSQMADAGLLVALFPDLGRLIGCLQNRHHHYDVFEHTMKAYYHLETILNDPCKLLPDTSSQIRQCIDEERTALLKCAILLHDIGKPLVKTLDKKGESHFYGHAQKSADMAQKIGKSLKFANREKRFIDFIIRNHIKPLFLFAAHEKNKLAWKGLTRFFIKCGNNTPFLLLHTLADIKAKQKQLNQRNKTFISFVKELIYDYFYSYKPRSKRPPLITGYDLIHTFGITPSPEFKTILNLVEEAKLTNKVNSRSEALALVKGFISSKI